MFEVPATSAPDRQFEIVLGDNLLTLRTYYNSTTPGWFLDLSDDAGAPLALGLALVPVGNVLASLPELTRTLGQFRVWDSSGGNNTAADGLGTVTRLYWFAPGEAEALAPAIDVSLLSLPFSMADLYHA